MYTQLGLWTKYKMPAPIQETQKARDIIGTAVIRNFKLTKEVSEAIAKCEVKEESKRQHLVTYISTYADKESVRKLLGGSNFERVWEIIEKALGNNDLTLTQKEEYVDKALELTYPELRR